MTAVHKENKIQVVWVHVQYFSFICMKIIIIIIIIGDSYAETTGLRQPGIPPTKVGTRNFGQTCSIGGTPPGKGAHPG